MWQKSTSLATTGTMLDELRARWPGLEAKVVFGPAEIRREGSPQLTNQHSPSLQGRFSCIQLCPRVQVNRVTHLSKCMG